MLVRGYKCPERCHFLCTSQSEVNGNDYNIQQDRRLRPAVLKRVFRPTDIRVERVSFLLPLFAEQPQDHFENLAGKEEEHGSHQADAPLLWR